MRSMLESRPEHRFWFYCPAAGEGVKTLPLNMLTWQTHHYLHVKMAVAAELLLRKNPFIT